MQIPKYWARAKSSGFFPNGKPFEVIQYGSSLKSLAEASSVATERVEKLSMIFTEGLDRKKIERDYTQVDMPREEYIEDIKFSHSKAVITRNNYGSLILNTDKVMFIDVDFYYSIDIGGFFKKVFTLLTKSQPKEHPESLLNVKPKNKQEKKFLEDLVEFCNLNQDFGARVYRTKAGLRLLVTSRLYDPMSDEAQDLMEKLSSDPLYRRLCRTQQCFRARLTPKSWRCGLKRHKLNYPYDQNDQVKFDQWLSQYNQLCERRNTCTFLAQIGENSRNPDIEHCVRIHDDYTGAQYQDYTQLA